MQLNLLPDKLKTGSVSDLTYVAIMKFPLNIATLLSIIEQIKSIGNKIALFPYKL